MGRNRERGRSVGGKKERKRGRNVSGKKWRERERGERGRTGSGVLWVTEIELYPGPGNTTDRYMYHNIN